MATEIPDDAVPVPGRMTMALNYRNLYGPDVDTACGAAEPDVDQWEAGELVPTRHQVELLAKLTGFPVHLFYAPMPGSALTGIICWRDKRGCEVVDMSPPLPGAGKSIPRQAALW